MVVYNFLMGGRTVINAMKFYRGAVAAIALVIVAMALTGCPDSGVVRDGVIVVDDVPGLEVTSLTENGIELETKVDTPIAVGDVLVGSKDDGGYLRRVTAVGQKGSTVFAETEKATLEDAVESGVMLSNFQIEPADIAAAGITTKGDKATVINFSGTDIYRDYGIAVTVDRGVLDCTPEFAIMAQYSDFKLQTFDMTTTGTISLDLDLKVALDNQTPLAGEWNIIPPIVHPFAASIGPVPVYGRVTMRFPIGLTGHMVGDTSVKSGLTVTDTFSIKANYANGSWDNSSADIFNFDVDGHPLTWNIDLGGTIQGYVKVVVELSLYESAELDLFLKPYLTSNIHIFPSPATIDLTAGLDAGGYFGLKVLGYNIVGKDFYWNGPSWLLYQGVQDYSDPLPWTSGSIELW